MDSLGSVWGIPVMYLKSYARKYRRLSLLFYCLDVLMWLVLIFVMRLMGSSFKVFMYVMLSLTVLVVCLQNLFLNYRQWNCYKFFRKYRGCDLSVRHYDLDAQRLFSVLYAMGYRRAKQGRSLDYYKEMVLSACCESRLYACKFMKLISKYENASGLGLITVNKGKRWYFVDFVNVDKEINDDGDTAGCIEE